MELQLDTSVAKWNGQWWMYLAGQASGYGATDLQCFTPCWSALVPHRVEAHFGAVEALIPISWARSISGFCVLWRVISDQWSRAISICVHSRLPWRESVTRFCFSCRRRDLVDFDLERNAMRAWHLRH